MQKYFRLNVLLLLLSSLLLLPVAFSYAGESNDTPSLYSKIEKIVRKSDDSKRLFWESEILNTGWIFWLNSSTSNDGGNTDSGGSDDSSGAHSNIVRWIEEFYSKLVLETYKSQFKKNLKDLDITLRKIYPEKDDRVEAYKKIKQTYENILKNLKDNTSLGWWISMSKKQVKIYEESLMYLIGLITLRISTLEN